jgi:dihydrofolate reductase
MHFSKRKIVTKTYAPSETNCFTASQWVNTALATGDLADEITKLKSEKGRDIILYGSATFDSSLIRAGLIDEFHLFINPAAIGRSCMTIFKDLNDIQKFTLVKSRAFDCGIVELHYEPNRI